jgi:GNAT superfamily N-acetyltransferase
MKLSWRYATEVDVPLLAEWNHQLIRDEGHRNPMTVSQLEERMKQWLTAEYQAVIYSSPEPVAYALFKREEASIYLRQLFVRRDVRRGGIGRSVFAILRDEIWPPSIRLTVDVLCSNQAAIAFWRSLGYQDYCLTLEIMPQSRGTPNQSPDPTPASVTPAAGQPPCQT